jgi:hypothetical protein
MPLMTAARNQKSSPMYAREKWQTIFHNARNQRVFRNVSKVN